MRIFSQKPYTQQAVCKARVLQFVRIDNVCKAQRNYLVLEHSIAEQNTRGCANRQPNGRGVHGLSDTAHGVHEGGLHPEPGSQSGAIALQQGLLPQRHVWHEPLPEGGCLPEVGAEEDQELAVLLRSALNLLDLGGLVRLDTRGVKPRLQVKLLKWLAGYSGALGGPLS